jgi:hypothetical protein
MNSMVELVGLESPEDFFAPASTDMIDGLVGQYRQARQRIAEVADFVNGELHAGVMHYFLEGNRNEQRGRMSLEASAAQLFNPDGAVAALNSAFWSKAMHLTDVLNIMPQARRDEWHKSIHDQTCPEFEEETVRSTLAGLLNMRSQFLAERVDGIFRGLSGEHVTNSPTAFGKRMIVDYVLNEWHSENYSKCGLINDLRCVIAKFMGRDEPGYSATTGLIRSLKGRWGEWLPVDGGALKIRLYKKGTAHIEVHPDMAWRLNATLANLYPLAIPPEHRQKPKRKAKKFAMIQRPLPFAVIDILAGLKDASVRVSDWPERWQKVPNALTACYSDNGKAAMAEAERILRSIGGVKAKEGWWQFDYSPHAVLDEIVSSGCIPDQKAHQFYPTPESVATVALEMADIGDEHACLEPSAGQGGLADLMPKERTTCVEISALHCQMLEAKGHKVISGDFIAWAAGTEERFDRVVMNPPFSEGRAAAHVEAAATLVKQGGRLVAILPASMRNKYSLPGFDVTWSRQIDNEFSGTSVSVAIMAAQAV